MRRSWVPVLLSVLAIPVTEAANSSLDQQFSATVRPFLNKYCIGCHSGSMPAAQLDFKSYVNLDAVVHDYPRWGLVLEKLSARQMPPSPMPHPPDAPRQQVIAWIQSMRTTEARKNAGDTGSVPARRLSNAEYNYTVRDLTGVAPGRRRC